MKTANLLHNLLCLLLACMIACSALFAWSLYEAHRQITALPAALTSLTTHIDTRLDAIETDADAQLTDLRRDTFQRLDKIELDANTQITATRGALTSRVDDSLGKVDAALNLAGTAELDANTRLTDAITAANTQSAAIATQLAAVTKPAAAIAAQLNEALPYILNCDPAFAGADCVPNKYLEITHSANTALFAVAQAAPAVATDIHGIADDAKQAADKFTAPPTKWQKVKAFAVTIGTIVAKGLL